ncbi:unnamed protein product [Adineta ricciae]|uniref:Uncharacterized protein n=1 Tax=Adineta ricciae TaxID=249248 RepID=A0A815VZ39_ADIRI|nr:unnamed protein product [Adineta ricciae]CAF1535176.1 unnamed protein product [Adineta ricciae]
MIEAYIEQHIQSFRLKIEHQIEPIHYYSYIRVLKFKYERYNPNQYQIQLIKQICQTQSTIIESIQNAEIRQHLYNQYRETALQRRTSLFQLYLTTAEDEKQEFQKKYEENMKQLQSDERFIDGNADFSSILFQIIHERCEKIHENNIHEQSQVLNPQQKKRCHGNRRDQRFRRKCRHCGMRAAKIEKVLQNLKHVKTNKKKKSRIESYMNEMAQYDQDSSIIVPSATSKQSTTTLTNFNKRKRNMSYQGLNSYSTVPKSTSSVSILQSLTKKTKQHMTTTAF